MTKILHFAPRGIGKSRINLKSLNKFTNDALANGVDPLSFVCIHGEAEVEIVPVTDVELISASSDDGAAPITALLLKTGFKNDTANTDEPVDDKWLEWIIAAAVIIGLLFNALGLLASPIWMLIAAAIHTGTIVFAVKKRVATWMFLKCMPILPLSSVFFYLLTRIVH